MDDDQSQEDESFPILLSDGEEEAPADPSEPQDVSPASESSLSEEQDDDENAPSESRSPESGFERESSLFVDQPGATISPEADDAESSQPDEDDEEEAQAEPEQPEDTHSPESGPAPDPDDSDHGDDDGDYGSDDSDDFDGIAPCGGAACQDLCDQYEQRILAKDRRNESLRDTIREKNARIRVLERRITDLAMQVRGLGGRPVWGARRRRRPGQQIPRGMSKWQNLLRRSISGNEPYMKAWRSSQQTLNMPVDNTKTHPGIRFVRKDSPDEPENMSPERDPIIPRMPEGVQLPDNVLFRILEHLLWYDGFLCHCISRLDFHQEPNTFPTRRELGHERTGIRGRFFFSEDQRTPVSLTHDTKGPNDVLAALLVSRKCCWYGIHIFCKYKSAPFTAFRNDCERI